METSEAKITHSRFGIASICIGGINILLIAYVIYRIAIWVIGNQEIMQDPRMFEGMQLDNSVYQSLLIIFYIQIAAVLVGVIGLFERDRKKATAIAGVSLNGVLALLTSIKIDVF